MQLRFAANRSSRAGPQRLRSTHGVAWQVRLANVDQYHSKEDGVWYPDGLQLRLGWQGSGSAADAPLGDIGWFNPFAAVPSKLVVEHFTEQLPAADGAEELQWAMPQYGSGAATAADRGNWAIALQDLRPHWLSKPGFLAFGALRAYPLYQMRKLCVALHERSLPLGHPAVQALVRQALYHTGKLTDSQPPSLVWRTDWAAGGDMLPTLCDELSALAAELEPAPCEVLAVLLLGEVAGYLSAWHPPLRDVARSFAAMAARWADDLEASALGADPVAAAQARAKQRLQRMTALLCLASCELDADDAQSMISLRVLIQHGAADCKDTGTAQQEQLAQLQVLCDRAMARRIDELVQAAVSKPEMLTQALRLVLQRAPTELKWWQLGRHTSHFAASFNAEGSDGHLYSFNVLDGTLLEDGLPPGRLPGEVQSHPLYKRTFGTDWSFEVTVASSGVWRTTSPVGGCFYEFSTEPGGGLVVVEIDEQQHILQLLDVGEGQCCGEWGAELPVRLRELHSHWLDRWVGVGWSSPVCTCCKPCEHTDSAWHVAGLSIQHMSACYV
jgi:hypothetical protein